MRLALLIRRIAMPSIHLVQISTNGCAVSTSNCDRYSQVTWSLLPLLFSDLQHAASGRHVIIVNASEYSCDVLVVFLDRHPVHMPLQIAQEEGRLSKELHTLTVCARMGGVTRELAFFLRKLWDQIVSPIVDCLKATHPSQTESPSSLHLVLHSNSNRSHSCQRA